MPIDLPDVSLVGAGVGATAKISLASVGISAGGVSSNPAFTRNQSTLWIFNDSGCGLTGKFKSTSSGFKLPAGAWMQILLPPGETEIGFTVIYVLPNPPVSLLMSTYYAPNEPVPSIMTLGNSPIGGGVQTSSIQTLSNEGNPAGTLVEDWGPAVPGQVASIWNDHFLWSVVQAGVAHQVLKGNTSGNPLQIGQAGDITEVLGGLLVDQLLSEVAAANALSVTNNATIGGTLGVTGVTTHTGNIIANGGENIDTIRENGTGITAMDLSAHTGQVRFPFPLRIIPAVAGPLAGSTSGTFTIYEFFDGSGATDLKLCVCVSNGFRNGGGSLQTLALPVAFQSFVRMWHGAISPATITKAGVTQNVGTIIGLPASNAAPGSVSVGATIAAYTLDDCGGGFDTISFNSGQASTTTGVSVWLGI